MCLDGINSHVRIASSTCFPHRGCVMWKNDRICLSEETKRDIGHSQDCQLQLAGLDDAYESFDPGHRNDRLCFLNVAQGHLEDIGVVLLASTEQLATRR